MSELYFPASLNIRIDWSDLDLFDHVNNVAFMKYVQAARVNYWEQIGLYQSFLASRQGPILASAECKFLKPLHYPGTVIAYSRLAAIGNSSFSLQHRLLDAQGDIAAEARDVMVMYDFNINAKMDIPDWMRKNIETLETP